MGIYETLLSLGIEGGKQESLDYNYQCHQGDEPSVHLGNFRPSYGLLHLNCSISVSPPN